MAEAAKLRHRNQSYRQALSSIEEIDQSEQSSMEVNILDTPAPIDAEEFENQTDQEKMGTVLSTLNLLWAKVKQIDEAIYDANSGLNVQLVTAQTQVDSNSEAVAEIKWENKVLKGLVHKQSKQIQALNEKVLYLTAKSMEKNIIITGLTGDEKKEDCKIKVLNFLKIHWK